MEESVNERQSRLVARFNALPTWERRYKELIEIGKSLPAFPESFRTDDYRVKGCQSQVWLHAVLAPGRKIMMEADSDALIVKGLVAILLEVFSGASPEEILSAPLDFIKELGFAENLSPSRASGLMSMIKQIRYYALAFQSMPVT